MGETTNDPNCGAAQDSKKRGKIPYWMKNVQSTPDLVLRYQVRTKEVEEALISDLRVLTTKLNQVWTSFMFTEYSLIMKRISSDRIFCLSFAFSRVW